MKKLVVTFKPVGFDELAKVLELVHVFVGKQVESFRIDEGDDSSPAGDSSIPFEISVTPDKGRRVADLVSSIYQGTRSPLDIELGGLLGGLPSNSSGYSVAPIRTAPVDDTVPPSTPEKSDPGSRE